MNTLILDGSSLAHLYLNFYEPSFTDRFLANLEPLWQAQQWQGKALTVQWVLPSQDSLAKQKLLNIAQKHSQTLQQRHPQHDWRLNAENLAKIQSSLLPEADKRLFELLVFLAATAQITPIQLSTAKVQEVLKALSSRFGCQTVLIDPMEQSTYHTIITLLQNSTAQSLSLASASKHFVISPLLLNAPQHFRFYLFAGDTKGYRTQAYDNCTLANLNTLYPLDWTKGELGQSTQLNNPAFLRQIIVSLQVMCTGYFQQDNSKKKLPLNRFGKQKFEKICHSVISPQHWLSAYEALPFDCLSKEQLQVACEVVEVLK